MARKEKSQDREMRTAFEDWMLNTEKWIVGSQDPYAKGGEELRWRIWKAIWAKVSAPSRSHE